MDWNTRRWTEHIDELTIELSGIDDFDAACGELARAARDPSISARYQSLCPMFGVIWPAARGLATAVARAGRPGERVLEIGCGLALPSLVAARRGARVVATDQHPDTATFLARNCALNGVEVMYRSFDWAGPLPIDVPERSFDRVIGSDVLYTDEMPAPVAAAYARFLAPGGVGWLTDPGRPWIGEFVDACVRRGLRVRDDVVSGANGKDEAFLFELRPDV